MSQGLRDQSRGLYGPVMDKAIKVGDCMAQSRTKLSRQGIVWSSQGQSYQGRGLYGPVKDKAIKAGDCMAQSRTNVSRQGIV